MKVMIFSLILALFSVPVFTVGTINAEDISEPTFIFVNETPSNLIHDLNTEFDRLSSKGYTHEDYDISDPMRDVIMNAVFPPGIEKATQVEKDEWAKDRVSLFESFHQYTDDLPSGERKIMFERTRDLMGEFIFVD